MKKAKLKVKPDNVSKANLIKQISESTTIPLKDVKAVVFELANQVEALAISGADVDLGFGKVVVKQKKERNARNPITGDTVKVPACNVVKFRPAKSMKVGVKESSLFSLPPKKVRTAPSHLMKKAVAEAPVKKAVAKKK